MSRTGLQPRVCFFAEIPTPYTVPPLEELARLVDLTVIFGAGAGSRGQGWKLDRLPFRHRTVGGMVVSRRRTRGTDVYVDPRVAVEIARARPHVVVSPAFSAPTAAAALYGLATGSRLLVYSVGTSLTERAIGAGKRLARRVLVPRASAFVAGSTAAARRFRELGAAPERVFWAPHATRMEPLWTIDGASRSTRPGALRALTVGRLLPRKGIDAAVSAVALARESEPGITLDVVGSGSEEERLRELAARLAPGAVRFHGFVDQPALAAMYRDADAFVFPSRFDQFGHVAVEAAAAGLPLVASPLAGATEDMVAEGSSGFVVDPDDVEGMADRLVWLARDPAARRRMGLAARERTFEHRPEATAARYAAAIEFALGQEAVR